MLILIHSYQVKMGVSTQILAFGDQTIPFQAGLRRLLRTQDNAVLASFFSKVHYALRLEIGQLPPSQRAQFPRFADLFELLPGPSSSFSGNCAIDSALVCAHQLASFIE